jgi:hypothetical protein
MLQPVASKMPYSIEKVGMSKKWIAITLLLFVIACLLGRQVRISVLRFYAENDLARIQPVQNVKQKNVQENPPSPLASLKKFNPSEFGVIPNTNVFAEYRSKEEKVEITAPPEPPALTQKPILVGVTIADGMKKASIIDPTSRSQEKLRRAKIKRIGDVYQGYTISDIALDHITLESGRRKEVIPLHEGSKRAQAGKTPILSTRVVGFGGKSSGGTQVSTVSGSPVRTPVVAVGSSKAEAPSAGNPETPSQERTAATNAQPAATQPAQTQRSSPTTDAQGRQGIRTPFGTVYRPKRD